MAKRHTSRARKKRGAGVWLVARDTGRVLLLRRSRECSEAGTWAIPGGKVDRGESAREAAIRELSEEAGWVGKLAVATRPAFLFERPGLEFLTFLGHVGSEFEPEINRESSDAGWFLLGHLPRPLHPGVRALVAQIKNVPR